MPLIMPRSRHISVVELWGVIGGAVRGAEYGRLFKALREDASVGAVVLDIDSPGGTATASDYLQRSLERLADRKPVVAFVRGMAASGGYLLCCGAKRVVALPSSIVGSIGVISVRPVVHDLLERLGVHVFVRKTGEYKDMWSMYRSPTREEERKLQALLDEFHRQFVATVSRTRGLSEETARGYATGEVFTAQRALEMGLVDELGDLESALARAAELGKVPLRVAYQRPRRPLMERLVYRAGDALARSLAVELEKRIMPSVEYRYRG